MCQRNLDKVWQIIINSDIDDKSVIQDVAVLHKNLTIENELNRGD